MMAKPIIALELHYPMIQFLIMTIIRCMAIYTVDSAIQCLYNRAKYFCLDTTQIWSLLLRHSLKTYVFKDEG